MFRLHYCSPLFCFPCVGATATPRQKFRIGDRSRRMWTPCEEEILASCLVELVACGWKSDNGFRADYLQKIEDSIRIEFPNTDIQGTPHVTSKISAWKKSYDILRNILARTRVGFNHDGTHKIDCDDEQWAQATWQMIFGKDRASGGAAEEVQKAAAELRPQRATVSECNENNFSPSTDDVLDSEAHGGPPHTDLHDDGSGNEGRVTSTTTKGTGKKRKVVNELGFGGFRAQTEFGERDFWRWMSNAQGKNVILLPILDLLPASRIENHVAVDFQLWAILKATVRADGFFLGPSRVKQER
ncbi:hypothetical protein SASPL_145371 [Salvia splendens]|uniref:Myb/SANT-like domain-containing protein n=1 Tax=Salvia splendens TaxID=180675 RepID=A0A8X8Z7L7_SALSN|nr:hypothetical protein SASPL_145371 [Salvia splendens]